MACSCNAEAGDFFLLRRELINSQSVFLKESIWGTGSSFLVRGKNPPYNLAKIGK